MCWATPGTVEALALRDSAPQFQGRVRANLVDNLMGVYRDMAPHPSRRKKGSPPTAMIAIGGGGR